jgi:hypothetical protein
MPDPERRERFDRVREAMGRVRSGESEHEDIWLPSGDKVTIYRDPGLPTGVRIETPRRYPPPPSDDARVGMVLAGDSRSGSRTTFEVIEGEDAPAEGEGSSPTVPGGEGEEVAGGAVQEGMSFRVRAFERAGERPPEYPTDLPFLPNCSVTISAFGFEGGSTRARNVAWMKWGHSEGMLEEIKAQLRESGWRGGDPPREVAYAGHIRTSLFTREGVERAVALIAFGEFSQIMLFERVGP